MRIHLKSGRGRETALHHLPARPTIACQRLKLPLHPRLLGAAVPQRYRARKSLRLRPSEAPHLEQVPRIGVLVARSPQAIRATMQATHMVPTEVKVVVARWALGSCLRLWG